MTATLSRPDTDPAPVPAKGLGRVRSRRRWVVAGFLGPAVLGFLIFFGYPLVATVYYSFTRYDLINAPQWIGFDNYVRMFTTEPLIGTAAYNTLWLVIVLTICRVLFALGVASVISRLKRGVGLIRTLCYMPALAPPAAATLVFVFVFNPEFGPINRFLRWVGVEGPLWFSDPAWSKPSLTLLVLWGSGELMIVILAALLDVPHELHEAAALDGAGPARRFWHITLPSISPVLLFGVVNSMIFALQFFTQAVVAASAASGQSDVAGSTQYIGAPQNTTLTYPIWLYVQGFRYSNMGYAAAMAVLLFVVSAAFTLVLVRQLRKASHVEESA
ncbi:carbohydrate ABC transporter permease [Kibdelosporangium phytohabitans]|uniref:Sugar ABC transporter permease n=1 Tax=Kibdelosporangium phytohabitans TaxID=860235 RepID=A0A0N9HPK0_9PSEU|nr:sugar ABC transporter permease [Kibdelosporangium phytohabitans]ALG08931.1 sugar ABC transporter permease [Kibdelosporangium phytohabitans]MBE1469908.1 multiple sugar transport system permease protein [Kibdelosporangium phytohabitans]